jgi:hypothetical protein
MNEYQAIAVYSGFAILVFAFAMVWRHYRSILKKRFHLLNYHSKGDDPKTPHAI